MSEERFGKADSAPPPPGSQAFVAVRQGDRSWIINLPQGEAPLVGPTENAVLQVDGLARPQGRIRWDGIRIQLERSAKHPPIFLNGKELSSRAILKPGDELSIGDTRMVVGLATGTPTLGRRALTHSEFRERVREEIARAARRGRQTSVVMVRAKLGEGRHLLETALTRLRAGDVVATYANDEIEFLLPDTSGVQARAVLTRIFQAAEARGYRAGISVAPLDADNHERMMRGARQALQNAIDNNLDVAGPPVRRESSKKIQPTADDASSQALVQQLIGLAPQRMPVLLTGEPSCGKGVFARILHDAKKSENAEPFVVIRCGALIDPETTTATLGPRGGLPDGATCHAMTAKGGTLVLDEVCELLPDPQERLLDILDVLGDDVRLVATTHVDLVSLANRGAFSGALQEALSGESVEVPALRQRPEDIIPLAESFAEHAGAPKPVKMSPGALARLRSHSWPGNVLELRNAMERAVRLANGGEILAEFLPSDGLPVTHGDGRLREHVDSLERDAIVKALAESNHNQTHAAKRLGISRRALIYKMEKYGLKPPPGQRRR